MGVIAAFFVGYVLGSRAGREGMEQLLDSVGAIIGSDEVRGMAGAGLDLIGSPLREILLPSNGHGPRSSSMADFASGVVSSFGRRVA